MKRLQEKYELDKKKNGETVNAYTKDDLEHFTKMLNLKENADKS